MKSSIIIIFILLFSCNSQIIKSSSNNEFVQTKEDKLIVHGRELKISTRFETPIDYKREEINTSFGEWLNEIPLNFKTLVYTYDGKKKANPNIYAAVLDLEQPKENVQFNANAIISLRMRYLYQSQQYNILDKMSNIETKPISYSNYVKGDYSHSKYMEYLTYYLKNTNSNTIKQLLKPIQFKELQVGDVFFQTGSIKSHAVIVMDMAKNKKGNKIYMLAQGYYPSQDIQILTNPSNDNISPWYEAKEGVLLTSEWRFLSSDLMRFK